MKLLRYAEERFHITIAVNERNRCQVLDLLQTIDGGLADKMIRLLDRSAAQGPPTNNATKVKRLRDDIWEFKAGPKSGAKLRVLYFLGNRNRIVCTNAFLKSQQKTPRNEIERAIRIKDQYLGDQITGNITLLTAEEFDNL